MRRILRQVTEERAMYPDDEKQRDWATAAGMLQALEALGKMSEWSLHDCAAWDQRMAEYGYGTLPLVAGVPKNEHFQEAQAVQRATKAMAAHGLPWWMTELITYRTSFTYSIPMEQDNPYWYISFRFPRADQGYFIGVIVDAVTGEPMVSGEPLEEKIQHALRWMNATPYEGVAKFLAHYDHGSVTTTDELMRQIWDAACDAVKPYHDWTQEDHVAWEQFQQKMGVEQDEKYPRYIPLETGMIAKAEAIQLAWQTMLDSVDVPEHLIACFTAKANLFRNMSTGVSYWRVEYAAPYTLYSDIIDLDCSYTTIDAYSGEVLTFDALAAGSG